MEAGLLANKPAEPTANQQIEEWKRRHPKRLQYAVKEPTILRDRKMYQRCLLPSYPDYAALNGALPPPPSDKYWEKQKDGSWLLKDKEVAQAEALTDEERVQLPEFIEHVVLRTDTAMGLRLKYKVTLPELRRHNNFFGDKISCCPVLKIPTANLPPGFKITTTHATKIQILRNKGKLQENEAKYYLELHEGDLDKAVEEAVADMRWEDNQTKDDTAAGKSSKDEKESKEREAKAKAAESKLKLSLNTLNPMVTAGADEAGALRQPLLQ
jgi:hypothetical protein